MANDRVMLSADFHALEPGADKRGRCPDGQNCDMCGEACWRVKFSYPLAGVYPGEKVWPKAIADANAGTCIPKSWA